MEMNSKVTEIGRGQWSMVFLMGGRMGRLRQGRRRTGSSWARRRGGLLLEVRKRLSPTISLLSLLSLIISSHIVSLCIHLISSSVHFCCHPPNLALAHPRPLWVSPFFVTFPFYFHTRYFTFPDHINSHLIYSLLPYLSFLYMIY